MDTDDPQMKMICLDQKEEKKLKDKNYRQNKQKCPQDREKERSRDKEQHKRAREDENYRQQERTRDQLHHQVAREDSIRNHNETQEIIKDQFWRKQVSKYQLSIGATLSVICGCCGGLWYPENVNSKLVESEFSTSCNKSEICNFYRWSILLGL